VARPRLELEDNASVVWSEIQVALNNWPGASPARGDETTSPSRTCMPRLAWRARTGWWYWKLRPKRGAVSTTRTGRTAPRTTFLFSDKRTATAKTTRSAKTRQIVVSWRGGVPSSPPRITCGTGRPRSAKHPQRRLQRGRHQTWQVSLRSSPAGRDSPPAAHGVFPAGRGASPAGHGAYPWGRGTGPSISWAHLLRGLPFPSLPPLHSRGRKRGESAADMRNKQDFL
jgi:hypothetical protein